jgi:DNA polymerase III epsilon subunit-like protein
MNRTDARHVTMRRMADRTEAFVSVDVEAAGGSPSVGSLLSIGACLVDQPEVGFYVELKPIPDHPWDYQAETIHGLDRQRLDRDGLEPRDAMERFAAWLAQACAGRQPVFVGFNAPFDWMFVADYFWRYLGSNPFGISALDLKSYFLAREDVPNWRSTRREVVDATLGIDPDHSHHALEDAQGQARIARVLLGRP